MRDQFVPAVGPGRKTSPREAARRGAQLKKWGLANVLKDVLHNRPISVYRTPRRAPTLCPQLYVGIQPGARFPARRADALPATLYGHFTQAIYRNRPIATRPYPAGLTDVVAQMLSGGGM
jgi:hypothetical protein